MPQSTKHILLLSSWYPTAENPFLGNFVQRNAELLGSKFQVSVITIEPSKTVSKITLSDENDGNLRTITVLFPEGNRFQNWTRKHKAFKKGLTQIESVHLIIGHVLLPNAWMFLEATRRKKAPLIWVEHGSYFRSELNKKWSPYEKWLLRRIVAISKEIVAVSETLKSDLKPFTDGKNISIIGNHIDEKLFTFEVKERTNTIKFLHVSTLDENVKNPKGIFEACFLLKEKNPNFELTVISDGDYEHWERLIQELDLQNQVRFVGPLNWHEIPKYYHQADAFVLFSEYETFSIVLAEALATGTPIISTNVGIAKGLSEDVIELVERSNVQELQTKMLAFINGELKFDSNTILAEGTQFYSTSILKKWDALIEKYAR